MFCLLYERVDNTGMAMSLVHGRISTQKIEIFFTVNVPKKNAFPAVEHYGEGMIIMRSVFFFEFEIIGCP